MDKIDRLMNTCAVEDETTPQASMDDGTGAYVAAPEPEPAPELTGSVGERMRQLVRTRQTVAMGTYCPLVRKLAQGKPLDDDDVVALADATRALGFPMSQPDADVEVVRQYEQCQAAGKQLAKTKGELATATLARDRHYQKLLGMIEAQKKLAGDVDELGNRLRFMELDAQRGATLQAAHPDLLK